MLDKILSCKIVYAQEILRCETTLIRKLVEIPKGNVKPHALISLPRVSSCNISPKMSKHDVHPQKLDSQKDRAEN
jgi:hypothetical protein